MMLALEVGDAEGCSLGLYPPFLTGFSPGDVYTKRGDNVESPTLQVES
jgi:hypothetical protein